MTQVYLRLFPYECGQSKYFNCPVYKIVPPKFRAKADDMFGIGAPENVPPCSMALEYNPCCGLDDNAKGAIILDWQGICSYCGCKPKSCQPEREYTYSRGKHVRVQPYTPRTLIRLASYDHTRQTLSVPDFLKIESTFNERVNNQYYDWVILTVNDDCVFDFSNPNNNTEWFNRIVKAIAMRDKLVIKR